MDKDKESKIYEMLNNMAEYSLEQPAAIETLCNELFISPSYAPLMDLLVESFLTVRSFCVLMFEGLISNASAILRILIEQVAAVTVLASKQNLIPEFLKFQNWKAKYYGSTGEEKDKIREYLFKESGYKKRKENPLKDFLDYGWIKALYKESNERGDKLIIKEAHLEETVVDIEEQLNAFAHGQRSIFQFVKHKDFADRHISRITMVAGKLFLFLCHAKHELLENYPMSKDKHFHLYLDAKILFCDLNSRATNTNINQIIKSTNNLDRDIYNAIATLDHVRGLMYSSELNYVEVNVLARAYILDLINLMYMCCFKMYSSEKNDYLDNVNCFSKLIDKVSFQKVDDLYNSIPHSIPLDKLIEMVNAIDDKWGPVRKDGSFSELDEIFITDFTTLVHTIFDTIYKEYDANKFMDYFVAIE